MNNNIAVGVGETEMMWKGHFGISPIYKIYTREGKFIEERKNPHGAGHDHDHGDDQPKVIKVLLHDCSTFIGKRMGEESKLKLAKKLGIETVLYKTNDPVEALNTYLGKATT
jgi:predicted Fe-Mo cluster-binding NifX family protein